MRVNQGEMIGRDKGHKGGFGWIRLVSFLFCLIGAAVSTAANHDWPVVGGDKGCTRYSSLTQITRKNVAELQVAWTFHTGDAGKSTTIECTPNVIGNVMFLTSANSKVVALDAAMGCELWRYDPY